MSVSNKQKLLNKKWSSAQPAIVDYRYACLENLTDEEAALLWEHVTKLDNQKSAVFEYEKRKQYILNKFIKKQFEPSLMDEHKEIERKYKKAANNLQLTLAGVAVSSFSGEIKNVLALEYINHEEEKTLRKIALKTLPEDVLTDWVCFRMSGDSAECLNAFAERDNISLSLLETITSQSKYQVSKSSVMASTYVSFMYHVCSKEPSNMVKIGILMLLLETCENNYMVPLEEASDLLDYLVLEYKEENDLNGLPDFWVYEILREVI